MYLTFDLINFYFIKLVLLLVLEYIVDMCSWGSK
jgi:hypothetical protein